MVSFSLPEDRNGLKENEAPLIFVFF